MAAYPAFVKATSRLPDTMTEQRANEELVLRFFALTIARDKFKGNIEEWLNAFMEDVLFDRIEFDVGEQRSRFERAFDQIATKFGDQVFTRFNSHGEATGRLAPAYFEAVCAAVDAHHDALAVTDSATLLGRLRSAFESEPFKFATGPGANTIPKLHQRIQVVGHYLLGQ
jgi:hypothetical protein